MMRVLLFFFLLICSLENVRGQSFSKAKHVLVIGVDGLSPRGITDANTPNLDQLRKEGAYSFEAQAVMPSVSSPNWASMIMGASPVEHGITSNDWVRADIREKSYCNGKKGEVFPPFFGCSAKSIPMATLPAFMTGTTLAGW